MSSKEAVHYNFMFCFRNTLYKPGEDPLQGKKDSLQNLPFFMALFVAGIYIFKICHVYIPILHELLFMVYHSFASPLTQPHFKKKLFVYIDE